MDMGGAYESDKPFFPFSVNGIYGFPTLRWGPA